MTKNATTNRTTSRLIALYREAALNIERGKNDCSVADCRASCCALWQAAGANIGLGEEAVQKYRALFLHSGFEENGWWNRAFVGMEHEGARVLALLLMAEMVEAGDA